VTKPGQRGSEPAGCAVDALSRTLKHPHRLQLGYQLHEIVRNETYLQHGVQVHEGDVVLDVGANVGVAAAYFASACRAGVVHCFEPVRPTFELLRENVSQFPACVAHNYGLSSVSGSFPITYYPNDSALSSLYADPEEDRAQLRASLINWGFSSEEADRELQDRFRAVTMACELRTLSSVLHEHSLARVDLLKIDVEKAEHDVLNGIEEGDWPRIAQVAAEVHDQRGRCSKIRDMLTKRGFSVTVAQDEVMRGTPVHMVYATRVAPVIPGR
jgi:FkbM family methyltransferase